MDEEQMFFQWIFLSLEKMFVTRVVDWNAWLMDVLTHDYVWLNWHPWLMHDRPRLSTLIHEESIIIDDPRCVVNGMQEKQKMAEAVFSTKNSSSPSEFQLKIDQMTWCIDVNFLKWF